MRGLTVGVLRLSRAPLFLAVKNKNRRKPTRINLFWSFFVSFLFSSSNCSFVLYNILCTLQRFDSSLYKYLGMENEGKASPFWPGLYAIRFYKLTDDHAGAPAWSSVSLYTNITKTMVFVIFVYTAFSFKSSLK